jgi:outer membrane autotransporter protein
MKKNLRSKILLCVLAGGVLAANTALAAEEENTIGTVIVDGEPKTIDVSKEYYSIGSNYAENVQITSDSGNSLDIRNEAIGTINGQQLNFNGGIYCRYNGVKLEIGTKGVTNTVSINSSNTHVVFSSTSAQVNINADNININSHADGDAPAVWVQKGGFVNLNGENINIKAEKYGLVAFSEGKLDINGNLVVNVKNNAIDTRGNAIININTDGKHTTVLNGDIVFETPAYPNSGNSSGSIINSNVNINLSGEESSWTGRAYQEYKVKNESGEYKYTYSVELDAPVDYGNVTGFKMNINNGASWNMTDDSFINNVTVENGGVINVQEKVKEFNVGSRAADDKGGITLNNGVINLQGENQQITATELDGTGGTVNTNSLNNKMSIGTVAYRTSITVNGSGEIADAIYGGDATAQDLANVVTTGTKSAASQITTDEGIIAGKITADVNADGKITNTVYAKNTTNLGLSNLAAINLMTWRQENNDMNKRLGELRDSKGEHGVWARMVRGEAEYESIQNQYNYYQIGYDEKLSTDPNWTVGMFLTRTEGNSTFRTGSAENNHTGVGVYGSYLKDDGSFIDLVAKYARIDSDFNANGGVGSGDYNTNGYSISAEYGKRFEQGNGFWIEPQVELTYGTVGAVDYTTSNGAKVRQEGMDSLVGRVGFSLGKDIKAGNIYARASYLYDFDGETEVTMSHSGISDVYEQDLGGGWFEVGLGANINLSDATHLYFDVEKTYGGDVETPWQWNAGMRWTF